MSEEMKMSDVLGDAVVNVIGGHDGEVIVETEEHSYVIGEDIDLDLVLHAVNNHDRLTEEVAELREALKSLHQSVLNVQLRGVDHVPSVRDRQSAMLAATKLLNK